MLTQERAIICEPEFPNYEAGWPGGGAGPLSWVAPWWQPVALSFASALVVLSPPVGAWVSSAASGTEGSRVGHSEGESLRKGENWALLGYARRPAPRRE